MFLPLTETLGLRKRGEDGRDGRGNPVPTYAAAVPLQVYGYGPRSSTEDYRQNRDVVTTGLTAYGPPSLAQDVSALDHLEVPLGGPVYEVDGEIADYSHGPFGWAPGVTINLRRVEG